MEKTLKRIQVLSKLGRILSTIVFVCSIVGAVGTVLGLFSLLLIGNKAFVIGGVTIHGMIETNSGTNMPTVYAAIVVGFICCLGEIFLAKMAKNYFSYELEVGTPFTLEGAKKLKKLGISAIVISVVCMILSGIAIAIVEAIAMVTSFASVGDIDIDIQFADGSQIALGIMFIVMSLALRYMAEKHGDDTPESAVIDTTFED